MILNISLNSLGRVVRGSARDVWANEALDLTPWLARKQKIILLEETIV